MSTDPSARDFDVPIRFLVETIDKHPCPYPDCTIAGCTTSIPTYRTLDGTVVDKVPGDVFFHRAHALDEAEGACAWTHCDGQHLFVVTPAKDEWGIGTPEYGWLWHIWNLDARAANCTLPADTLHRCWCRSGDPRVPGSLHVAKDPGPTCSAGGGSFGHPQWHGVLHQGRLRTA